MKKMKKILSLVLAMVLCAGLLAACGGQEEAPETTVNSNEAAYRVSVVDALGHPYTEGVIVRFLQNGEPVAMQVVDANGVVEKVLEKGDYTVDLAFTGDETGYHYEQEGLTLSADAAELEVTLAYAVNTPGKSLYAQAKETTASYITAGCTYVTLEAGERNYFLFTPATEGTYEFSFIGDAEAIGYYGAPHFVQELSAADVVDNAFTISVTPGMIGTGEGGTTVLVIGIDAGSAEDCVLTIDRLGEHQWTVEDEVWQVYETTVELSPYTLPSGAVLQDFDLTAATGTYNLVLNEADGFYHLDFADGPLVLVRLAEKNQYLDSFKTILENTAIRRYFFDDNGDFIRKEEYSNCVLEYLECVDENAGVYPLTEDLKYIIQQHGGYAGWFDENGGQYLFVDGNGNHLAGINSEISWLFMCCYILGG